MSEQPNARTREQKKLKMGFSKAFRAMSFDRPTSPQPKVPRLSSLKRLQDRAKFKKAWD